MSVQNRAMPTKLFYWVVLLCFALLLPTTAMAQDAPLRMGLINTAGYDGEDAYNTVLSILGQSSHIQMIPQSTLVSEMPRHGISVEALRQASQRQRNTETMRQFMRALDLEVILLQDVFNNGNKLQLVIIGPYGNELSDIRRDVNRGQISQEEALGMLRQIFSDAVPEVRNYRENGDPVETSAPSQEPAYDEPPREQPAQQYSSRRSNRSEQTYQTDDLRDEFLANRKIGEGILHPHYNLKVGFLTGHRDLNMNTDGEFELRHATPFTGLGLKIDTIFQTMSSNRAGSGATFVAHYAPFQTVFSNEVLASNYLRLAGDLYYARDIASFAVGRLYFGGEFASVTIATNPVYTGNSYINARAGLGLNIPITKWITLDGQGGVVPVINADNSGGAFGNSKISFGYEVNGAISIHPLSFLTLSVDYGYQSLVANYPEPMIMEAPVTSVDAIHMVLISVGYHGKM